MIDEHAGAPAEDSRYLRFRDYREHWAHNNMLPLCVGFLKLYFLKYLLTVANNVPNI